MLKTVIIQITNSLSSIEKRRGKIEKRKSKKCNLKRGKQRNQRGSGDVDEKSSTYHRTLYFCFEEQVYALMLVITFFLVINKYTSIPLDCYDMCND